MKEHSEIKIKILRDSPRDTGKLIEILKVKQKDYEEAQDSKDIERLVSEIETFKLVLFLVSRREREEKRKKYNAATVPNLMSW